MTVLTKSWYIGTSKPSILHDYNRVLCLVFYNQYIVVHGLHILTMQCEFNMLFD